jgi:spermidine synthase
MSNLPAGVTLSRSGFRAQLSKDRFTASGVVLSVDGIAQSQVNPEDPTDLQFEYIRRIGHIVDLFRPPEQPITAVHLGAGALSVPRYIAHTRPGSRSQVIEWEQELVDLVRAHLPWDSSWSIRVRYGDARETLRSLPSGLMGSVGLVVVDLFSGNSTPSHLTTLEFYQEIRPLLRPDGLVVINVVDGRPQDFTRAQCRTLREAFGFVGLSGESGVVRGRRFGNVVLVATIPPDEPYWWGSLQRLGPHPTSVLSGISLDRFIAHAPLQTDAQRLPSPRLGQGFFGSEG